MIALPIRQDFLGRSEFARNMAYGTGPVCQARWPFRSILACIWSAGRLDDVACCQPQAFPQWT